MSVAEARAREPRVVDAPPPHAPEAGWIRRLLGPFYVTGIFWYRVHDFGIRRSPAWFYRFEILVFATFFFVVLRNIRDAVASNLEAVLGPSGWLRRQVRIYKTLWAFAWGLTERYERLSTEHPFDIAVEAPDGWHEMMEHGLILVTAHLGSWEVGSMLPSSCEHRRVHVVREAETDPKAQEFISGLIRNRAGDLYVTHFAEDPQLGMVLLDALRRGEIVALQGDRPRNGGRISPSTLFGRPFQLPIGTAALARAAEVPLVPVFVYREGRRRYRCVVHTPIQVAVTADRQADIEAALASFAKALETAIVRKPHQWFCFRRLWPPP